MLGFVRLLALIGPCGWVGAEGVGGTEEMTIVRSHKRMPLVRDKIRTAPAFTFVESVVNIEVTDEDGSRRIEAKRVPRRLAEGCDYSSVFDVTFAPSPAPTAQLEAAESAAEEALCIWSNLIEPAPYGGIRLRIDPVAALTDPTILAETGPSYLIIRTTETLNGEETSGLALYSAAQLRYGVLGDMREKLTELQLNYDGDILFNSAVSFFYGVDGTHIQADEFDFVSVAAHEIGHVMGFGSLLLGDSVSSSNEEGGYVGPFWLETSVRLADTFALLMVDQASGLSLTPENFDTSKAAGQTNTIFTASTLCIHDSVLDMCIPIHTPAPFVAGSSMSHWAEDFYPTGSFESLMTPCIRSAEVIRCVGDVTKRVFGRLGFTMSTDCQSTCVNLVTGAHSSECEVGSDFDASNSGGGGDGDETLHPPVEGGGGDDGDDSVTVVPLMPEGGEEGSRGVTGPTNGSVSRAAEGNFVAIALVTVLAMMTVAR